MPTLLPLEVLLLEDRASDAELVVDALRQDGYEAHWRRVESKAAYLEALNAEPDIILSDYTLPQLDAPLALRLLRERGLDIPFIVVTGTVTEDSVIECIRQGAADYLMKDRLARLGAAVTKALGEKRLRMEMRQAEKTLRENEERIRRLTENALDVIYRYRLFPTPNLEYINPVVTAITGYTPAEFYAKEGLLFNLIYEEDDPLLQELIDPGTDLAKTVTLRWVHKDGSIRWTEQRCVLMRDEAGHVLVIEGIVRDITDRKRLEEETRKADLLRIELEKEKELNQLKEQFISVVSHEFRTPLTVIMTSGELVEQYYDRLPTEKRLGHLRQIQNQVHILIALLDDVLDFSKAQAGKLEFSPKTLDVGAFCTEIFESIQTGDAGAHQFIFVNQSKHDEADLDTRLVHHILINLLSNAIKYSPLGGEVRFELSSEENHLVFQISDEGIGIPADDLLHLFEPFHRAKNATKIQGTGLGMSIVKSNVEAHGGTISVESQEGKGTIFTVRLPTSARTIT